MPRVSVLLDRVSFVFVTLSIFTVALGNEMGGCVVWIPRVGDLELSDVPDVCSGELHFGLLCSLLQPALP